MRRKAWDINNREYWGKKKTTQTFGEKNTISWLKCALEGINNRQNNTEEKRSELDDTARKTIKKKQNIKKKKKEQEQSISKLWNNFKLPSIHVIKILIGERRAEKYFTKVMDTNVSNFMKFVEKYKHIYSRNWKNFMQTK